MLRAKISNLFGMQEGSGVFLCSETADLDQFVPLVSKLMMGDESLISQCSASELSTPFLSFNFVATRKEGEIPIINIDSVTDLGFPIDQAHFDK